MSLRLCLYNLIFKFVPLILVLEPVLSVFGPFCLVFLDFAFKVRKMLVFLIAGKMGPASVSTLVSYKCLLSLFFFLIITASLLEFL